MKKITNNTFPMLGHFINTWNIFSRAQLLKDYFSSQQSFCVVTKQENIKKYENILQELKVPHATLMSVQDIGNLISETPGIFLCSPEFFECKTPNLYTLENTFNLKIEKWKTYDISQIIKKLQEFWYVFHDFLEGNDYKRQWDTLHIKWKNDPKTYLIHFWWDEIEAIGFQENNTFTEIDHLNIYSWNKIDIFDSIDMNKSGFFECLESKNIPVILDMIDIHNVYKLFENYQNLVAFDIFKSALFDQKNLHITDIFIENLKQLEEKIVSKEKKTIFYTKSPKVLQNFLTQNNFYENIEVIQTHLVILKSYQTPQVQIICDDNLSKIFIKKRKRKSVSENVDLLLHIKSGDYVVHRDHGIWIFSGIIEKEVGAIRKEYIEIHYQANDKLFVPITEIKRVSKYLWSEDPKLTRLNTKEWSKKLDKASEDVYKTAQELLEIYAQRKILQWYSFPRNPQQEHIFQKSFEYEYTLDQQSAIEDILWDMEKPIPMDRILVGDVGFWKTEIAFHAIYNAFLQNKQSILLSPLVVLAYEHYEKAKERFADFGIKIWLLTRFEKPKIVEKTLKDLENGTLDLVIGTHKLLDENIVYKNLWLLIIDEEHKFWVKDKEAIKKIKNKNLFWIDILSMSATPIPRSLNMALGGIKDISILAHPPRNRLPIDTSISQFDDTLIFQTGQREFARNWQLYFIHNRVDTIENVKQHLQKIFPDRSIIVTHGQLVWDELEQRIIDFKQKKYDILLSTTVIENGIDFPNVNTIIINDAYKFGISQIHQLRGRVGRTERQWYCVLLFAKDKIQEDAAKRLSTMVEYSHLWAGFELAVKDLENRGGWEILWIQQSGKTSEIGITLYMNMLEEKIQELKNNHFGEISSHKKIETTLDLNVEAYIPSDLFQNELDKIQFYKEIESISDFEELDEIIQDFSAQNESLSPSAFHLFMLLKVRIQASNYGIVSIKRMWVSYHIDFESSSTIETLKNFLDLDEERYFSVVDLTKVKCVVSKFKNDTEFLQYLDKIFFQKKENLKKRKIIIWRPKKL